MRGVFGAALLAVVGLLSAASAQAATLPTLTVSITKTSITVAGAEESGAVNVVTSATGVKEAGAILFLLKPGATFEEVETAKRNAGAAGHDPNFLSKYGTIVFDTEVAPGKSSEGQTVLQPGRYVAAVPGEGKGSKVHAEFTVTSAASPATLPTPQATVRSIEFGFRGPTTLHDGELVRFENEGYLVHMDIALPVKSEKIAKQLVKDLLAGKEKASEKLVAGAPVTFAGPMSHESLMQETITAKPGWYVQACFMETQDGRDHTRLGMERIIKIVK
ncbi:MAG: hypothetical protein ABSG95_15725 [Solirubrobacteraceae bacterium]|jgi:hypothetical protein